MSENLELLTKSRNEWKELADSRGATLQTVCLMMSQDSLSLEQRVYNIRDYLKEQGWIISL